jgi:hypothetical protein
MAEEELSSAESLGQEQAEETSREGGGKENTNQRLKRQRDAARVELANQSRKLEELERELQGLRSTIGEVGAARSTDPNKMPIERLDELAMADNPESPGTANFALVKAMQRREQALQKRIEEAERKAEERIKAIERERAQGELRSELVSVFGKKVLDPDSDLRTLADDFYGQIMGPNFKEHDPRVVKLAFYEAERRLAAKKPKAQETKNKDQKPPRPEDLAEAGSSSLPDLVAESRAALAKGDVRGSMRAKMARLLNSS